MNPSINVVVLKDGDTYIAQCLEVDIAAQGATEAEAGTRLRAVFAAEKQLAEEQGRSIMDIGPAPAAFRAAMTVEVISKSLMAA